MPTKGLIVICNREIMKQIKFSPPVVAVDREIQRTSEIVYINNPGDKPPLLQTGSESRKGKIADT